VTERDFVPSPGPRKRSFCGDFTLSLPSVPMSALPSISVVVPNFNNGNTVERALQSLIDQDYPRLEIVVVDGGSADGSVEVIRRFEPHITWWTSEKDRGQSHAINKGLARTTGEIVNWLCSDDYLLPGALLAIGQVFANDISADVVLGAGDLHRIEQGTIYRTAPTPSALSTMPCNNPIVQPACFFRRKLLQRTPAVLESLNYALDFELWNYFMFVQHARFVCLDRVLAVFPFDGANKTSVGGSRIIDEIDRIYRHYTNERIPLTYWHRKMRLPLERWRENSSRWSFPIVRILQIASVLVLSPFYGMRRVRAMNWSAFV
jgi:glycosyltransferase involved in cell wall biosynthesis